MTPHNKANIGDIAKTVIMPGDPLRAKKIAEEYLDEYKLVNDVRNIYAYTGTYKGKKLTVMASGMGMPSMGIYSYELYKFYDVDNIIRVGSAGSYSKDINLYDVVLATESYTKSTFAKVQGYNSDIIESDNYINDKVMETAQKLNINLLEGRVHTTDVFYIDQDADDFYYNKKCICTEMESFALFYNAKKLNKKTDFAILIILGVLGVVMIIGFLTYSRIMVGRNNANKI